MEEIFNKSIEEFIEANRMEIIQNIHLKECNYIIENETEYVDSLINQFTVSPITVEFDEITYSEEKSTGYYQDETPVDVTTYKFKVPFKGNLKLLDYHSNNGEYKDKTYFVEKDYIYFKSLNFDLKPVTKRCSNTIDVLKSIISNLNKDYEDWNKSLDEFIENKVKTRKNRLCRNPI